MVATMHRLISQTLVLLAISLLSNCRGRLPTDDPPANDGKTTENDHLPNSTFLNQHGKPVRFLSDVVGEYTIILNFVFTTCRESCPFSGANFARIEKELARRGDTKVRLVSITSDPEHDTPERLKQWAARFGGGHRWQLLTGSMNSIQELSRALTGAEVGKGGHMATVLTGDRSKPKWTRSYGLDEPNQIIQLALSPASTGDLP
jgi:protein SCO1